ncbi:MAG: cytochrome c, partial [Alphaproteobacteria bacterium]|nr:cytochrome c [Alphaproteobacteria bacterium]
APLAEIHAHEGASGIVMQRMETMKYAGVAMKKLKAIFTGQAANDPEEVAKLTKVIESIGGEKLLKLFPKGSLQGPTEALPFIWERPERFKELANQLPVRAKTLAEDPTQMNFVLMAKTCGDCHTDFRKKKN